LLRIRNAFAARQFPAEFVFTESVQDLELLASQAIAAGRRVLLALGGDGTFQGLANAAFGRDVLVGILPAGGGNDFAYTIGMPKKDPTGAARAILASRPRAIDLLRARTADGRERLYAGGGGIGLDAEAARHAATTYRHLPGRLRYLAGAVRAFCGFQRLTVHAQFPGSEVPPIKARALVAAALNTPMYGAGIRLAPAAQVDDGLLTAIVVKDLSALEVLALVPRLLLRGDLPNSKVQRVSVPRVRLTADCECLFHGDGEILGPAPVEIEVVPNAIRVLAPTR
jgi:diacylglycerol kinase (ATP)